MTTPWKPSCLALAKDYFIKNEPVPLFWKAGSTLTGPNVMA